MATRRQAIIRSDIANRLTKQGQQAMLAYGGRTAIDLRSPREIATEPSPFVSGEILTYLNLPFADSFSAPAASPALPAGTAEMYGRQ